MDIRADGRIGVLLLEVVIMSQWWGSTSEGSPITITYLCNSPSSPPVLLGLPSLTPLTQFWLWLNENKMIAQKHCRRWWYKINCNWWQRWWQYLDTPSPFRPMAMATISKELRCNVAYKTYHFWSHFCPSCLIWLDTIWPSHSCSDIWKRGRCSPSHWT